MHTSLVSLEGKRGIVLGIANEHSIAWGCARMFHQAGASLAATYLNDKAKPHMQPLAESLSCPIILPCDVQNAADMKALFAAVEAEWGTLDFLLHSIAYAPLDDLHGRVLDCSAEGFAKAMDVSCHSFIRAANYCEPLMKEGGSLLTVSYFGSEQVVAHYNMMGPVKAALESTVRYLAAEMGGQNIRVNALSPGPIATRAASGIAQFPELLREAERKSPLHRVVDIDDCGKLAAFLVSDAARNITGNVHYIDAGYAIMD